MTDVAAQRTVQHGWTRGEPLDALLTKEWLVANALGGYAGGTIGGACTRRYHGQLIAALRAPLGRTMMFNHIEEVVQAPGVCYRLSGDEHGDAKEVAYPEEGFLEEFLLEEGMPVWRFAKNGVHIEKRVLMPHLQNTTYIVYRLIDGPAGVTLRLRPSLHFRPHEGLLTNAVSEQWTVHENGRDIEIDDGQQQYPNLKLTMLGTKASLQHDPRMFLHVLYRIEKSRGYEYEGPLWSPGVIVIELQRNENAGVIASTEAWDIVHALTFDAALSAELERRERLLSIAGRNAGDDFSAQLVLAADQFLIHPHARVADEARVKAAGDEPRTVIAGYHWFTDWGRDTMISLEGLTLVTGRHREAGNILRTFASYIHDGLIPNLFPEGQHGGLYHTADATMWFFHAVWRYFHQTHDSETVNGLVPKMLDIIDWHMRGTEFGIGVDPADGLLREGQEGYQLTWMDAKVGDWVVTPRRGKPVEINALFYNALRILERLLLDQGDAANARRMDEYATRVRLSFNHRFWYDEGQYLYDVVDAEGGGSDPALRPNQLFAVSLDFPVLDEARWKPVFDAVEKKLLTPVGLRSLSPDHPDYKPKYDGDLRARDAAYHQGTVWPWLIGAYIDARLKVHPKDTAGARTLVEGFQTCLSDACIGTISEIFDAEPPFHPRGCAAQAWSVAEVLRCLAKV